MHLKGGVAKIEYANRNFKSAAHRTFLIDFRTTTYDFTYEIVESVVIATATKNQSHRIRLETAFGGSSIHISSLHQKNSLKCVLFVESMSFARLQARTSCFSWNSNVNRMSAPRAASATSLSVPTCAPHIKPSCSAPLPRLLVIREQDYN
ncbi:hypothetical protein EVAR_85491_1 [Eumeta japonica]|uniref:Uncharacterized protein n=1 Tax=Eumeta variegata TaxID=151549 RepID=A0A4C1VE56_EUMVA|nr:hypothetical protein EVAR_85491_1 [Eumeta japonica]